MASSLGWIKDLGRQWGHHMRRQDAMAGNIKGTMGRIHEEGLDGAAIRSYVDKVPYNEFPSDVRKFHLAFLKLDTHLKSIVFIHFRLNIPHKKKHEKTGKKQQNYYDYLNLALDKITQNMAGF